MTLNLIVVRHGESETNLEGIISDAKVDPKLTVNGQAQAQALGGALKGEGIDLVVSSSRQRALDTARAINAFHQVPVDVTDDLIERHYGIFSGMKKTIADQIMQSEGFGWLDIPGSETAPEINRRVGRVIKGLMQNHSGKTILISTHEDVVRSFHRVIRDVSDQESLNIRVGNSDPHHFVIER